MFEKRGVIGIALIDNSIIVGRRRKNPDKNKLEIPGGKISILDYNPIDTARREFREELPGLFVEGWALAFIESVPDAENPLVCWTISCYIGECSDLPPKSGPAHTELLTIDSTQFHQFQPEEWALDHHRIIASFWQHVGL